MAADVMVAKAVAMDAAVNVVVNAAPNVVESAAASAATATATVLIAKPNAARRASAMSAVTATNVETAVPNVETAASAQGHAVVPTRVVATGRLAKAVRVVPPVRPSVRVMRPLHQALALTTTAHRLARPVMVTTAAVAAVVAVAATDMKAQRVRTAHPTKRWTQALARPQWRVQQASVRQASVRQASVQQASVRRLRWALGLQPPPRAHRGHNVSLPMLRPPMSRPAVTNLLMTAQAVHPRPTSAGGAVAAAAVAVVAKVRTRLMLACQSRAAMWMR